MIEIEAHGFGGEGKQEIPTWLEITGFISKECPRIMGKLDSDLKKILGLIESNK
jgi:hypothetical protein